MTIPLNIGFIGAGRLYCVTKADARAATAIAATRSLLDEARPVMVAEVGGWSEGILIKTLDSSLDF